MCFTVGQIKEKPFARGSTPRGHYRVVSGVVERERKRGREFSGPWTASNLALLSFFISLSSKGARRAEEEQKRKSIFDDDALRLSCILPTFLRPVPLRPGFRGERTLDCLASFTLFFSFPSFCFLHAENSASDSLVKTNEASRGRPRDGARVHFWRRHWEESGKIAARRRGAGISAKLAREIRSASILPFIYLFIERTLEISNLSRLDEEIPCINILRNVINFNDPKSLKLKLVRFDVES